MAAGRYDGYWERRLQSWDLAAGSLIVREAGGLVEPLNPNGNIVEDGEIICANEPLFEQLAKIVRQ